MSTSAVQAKVKAEGAAEALGLSLLPGNPSLYEGDWIFPMTLDGTKLIDGEKTRILVNQETGILRVMGQMPPDDL